LAKVRVGFIISLIVDAVACIYISARLNYAEISGSICCEILVKDQELI